MATTSHEEPKKSPTAEDIEPDFSEFQDLHFNLFEKIAEYWNSDTLHQAEPWNPESIPAKTADEPNSTLQSTQAVHESTLEPRIYNYNI